MNYKRVRENYITGLWTKALVKAAYQRGIITLVQYKEIIALPQSGGRDEDKPV